jgi:uncharacterized SAM-binding protein YcdF (DUF218 family)
MIVDQRTPIAHLCLVRLIAAGLAFAFAGWLAGFIWFVQSLPRQPNDEGQAVDGIVVLTGGSERLQAGFRLLKQGLGKRLFISGVYHGIDVRELMTLTASVGADGLECCIDLGYDADNTAGNAEETARWVQERGMTSLRLVTANYHMPRSLLELRRRLGPDVVIFASPVAPPKVMLERWWLYPGTANLLFVEYNKYLLAWLRTLA